MNEYCVKLAWLPIYARGYLPGEMRISADVEGSSRYKDKFREDGDEAIRTKRIQLKYSEVLSQSIDNTGKNVG